jgi:ATP-dependent DNA helicase RecG
MRYRESEIVELKRSTAELKEAVISAAAILNKHPAGRVLFGVRNDGAPTGQTVSEHTLRDVARAFAEHIEPRVYPQVRRLRIEGKDCVEVRFAGSDAPYLAYGRAYMRVADEDRQLSARELERMFLRRARGASPWEAQPSDKTLRDADAATVRRLVKKGRLSGRLDFAFSGIKSTLTKLKLLRGGRLLRAAQILFCKDNDLRIQAAVFAGTDKDTFLDLKQFGGTLFSVLEAAETYVKEHIDWRVRFGRLEREEVPEIPLNALREALVNSLCHRDYAALKSNEVAVFKDRVEIYNPGEFPEGFTPEDFIHGEEHSVLRNPRIARVLFRSRDVEEWGSGLKRISKECAQNGVRVEFKVLKSGFLVTFHRAPTERPARSAAQKAAARAGKRLGEKLGEKLGENQRRILDLILEDRHATIRSLSEQLKISTTATEKNLAGLKNKGLLRRAGPDKGGHWEIIDPPGGLPA